MANSNINRRRGVNQSFQMNRSQTSKQVLHNRTKSQGIESRYRNIPSENIKFQQFIDLIYESKMEKDDQKFEVLNYVQALETNYNDTIKEQKQRGERLKN